MNHLRRMISFLLVLVLCFGLIPGVSAAEVDTPGADTQTEAAETEETASTTVDTQPTEELPPEMESESTEPPSADVPMEEPGLMDAIFTGASVMSIASTQNSIMLFDFADNGNYTTVLNSQVACAYKPNGTGTTRTAYIKNLGWHFARYGGVAYADDPLYCIEPWRSYAASTSGNSVDRDVTLDGSGSTSGSNVWYALPAARREAIGLILLYSNQMWNHSMKEMFRDVIQQVMEVEMDEELGRERCQRAADPENATPNYRNGYSQKTVKTQLGEIDIKVPRDRKGNYEPKIISKYDRNAEGMEDKILSLYACGMSQRDIAEQIKSLYDVEISPELVSKISEKIMPEVNAWQNRPLESVYPFIFMDAIHYKVKEDHRYVTKAAYVVLGITMDGRKDILGVWIGEHESSKFWLSVLNDLKSRGVLDVYLFCTDGLCGMTQAIQAVYPKSRLQRCIVHQIRSSTKYVSYKDIKKLVADLKKIYTAVTIQEAEENLRAFGDTWRKQYPSCVKSWEDNWEVLSTFFEYPPEIRKIIYTTNIIEGLNRQFRQITKNKPSFTNDDSLRRMLYLASQRIVRHWHARCQNWDMVLSQLEIMFSDRKVG